MADDEAGKEYCPECGGRIRGERSCCGEVQTIVTRRKLLESIRVVHENLVKGNNFTARGNLETLIEILEG